MENSKIINSKIQNCLNQLEQYKIFAIKQYTHFNRIQADNKNYNEQAKKILLNLYEQSFYNAQNQLIEIKNNIPLLKILLNQTYTTEQIKNNGFQIGNINNYKQIFFNKPNHRFNFISNIGTLKDNSIFQNLKELRKENKISYQEYINVINRLNNSKKIREDNKIKKEFRNLLLKPKNKEYLYNKYGIDIFKEFQYIQNKLIIPSHIQNLLNAKFRERAKAKYHSKNTISHLNRIDNKRFIYEFTINQNKVYVYLKKSFSSDLEKYYKMDNPFFIDEFFKRNNHLILLEAQTKFINDITILKSDFLEDKPIYSLSSKNHKVVE